MRGLVDEYSRAETQLSNVVATVGFIGHDYT
jgi:hypothetical protein